MKNSIPFKYRQCVSVNCKIDGWLIVSCSEVLFLIFFLLFIFDLFVIGSMLKLIMLNFLKIFPCFGYVLKKNYCYNLEIFVQLCILVTKSYIFACFFLIED